MTDKPQICVIHGGDAFESDAAAHQALENMTLSYERILAFKSWKLWLAEQLPDHDIVLPNMPSKFNAKYDEWEILFSKVVPFLRPDAVLIGHSLGGGFLAKYLCEHPSAEPFAKLIIVAGSYDDENEDTLGGFKLSDVSKLSDYVNEIHLVYSNDDPYVKLTERDKYLRDLPNSIVHNFSGKGHFNTTEFPELLEIV